MATKVLGDVFHTTRLCVDSYDRRVLQGRLYNPFVAGGIPFGSLMELLLQTDALLDEMHFPQPFSKLRSFQDTPEPIPPEEEREWEQVGLLATFRLKIIFRQNASWQGTLFWLEKNREESFRSFLELAHLLDSALSSQPDG
ncbi:MAG: hypothetical protein RR092_02140 [Oscillospiraceae bacterium]